MKNPFIAMALAVAAMSSKFAELMAKGTLAEPVFRHRSTNKFTPGQSGTGKRETARRRRQMESRDGNVMVKEEA